MGLQDLFDLLTTGRGGDILGTGAGLALLISLVMWAAILLIVQRR